VTDSAPISNALLAAYLVSTSSGLKLLTPFPRYEVSLLHLT